MRSQQLFRGQKKVNCLLSIENIRTDSNSEAQLTQKSVLNQAAFGRSVWYIQQAYLFS